MHVEAHHTADELAARIRSETRAKVGRRLTAVRLALLGHRPEDIAPHVFLSARQVRTWVTRYTPTARTGSPTRPAGVGSRRSTRPPGPAWPTASGPGRPRPTGSAPSAGRMSASSSGGVRSGPVVVRGLPPPPRPRVRAPPPPAPPPEGVGRGPGVVSKKFPGRVAEVAAARPGERVEVWFEDEARFGQKGTLTTVWAEGEPADGPEAGGVREPPRPDRGVPGDRAGRRVGRPGPEHRGGAVVPGPVVGDHPRRDARGAGVGRGRVPLGGQVPDRPG